MEAQVPNTEDGGNNQSAMAESYGSQIVCNGAKRNSSEQAMQITMSLTEENGRI